MASACRRPRRAGATRSATSHARRSPPLGGAARARAVTRGGPAVRPLPVADDERPRGRRVGRPRPRAPTSPCGDHWRVWPGRRRRRGDQRRRPAPRGRADHSTPVVRGHGAHGARHVRRCRPGGGRGAVGAASADGRGRYRPAGCDLSAAQAFQLAGSRFYLFGMGGDQAFRMQYLGRFAASPALADGTFADLPSFYPPAWFSDRRQPSPPGAASRPGRCTSRTRLRRWPSPPPSRSCYGPGGPARDSAVARDRDRGPGGPLWRLRAIRLADRGRHPATRGRRLATALRRAPGYRAAVVAGLWASDCSSASPR